VYFEKMLRRKDGRPPLEEEQFLAKTT